MPGREIDQESEVVQKTNDSVSESSEVEPSGTILFVPYRFAPVVLTGLFSLVAFVIYPLIQTKFPGTFITSDWLTTSVQITALVVSVLVTTHVFYERVDKIETSFKTELSSVSKYFVSQQAEQLKDHTKLKILTIDEAEREIQSTLTGATRVINTYVNISRNFGADSNYGSKSESAYVKFLSASTENSWHDITTYADFYEGRYDKLLGRNDLIGGLQATVIDGETDVVNFLLAKNERSENTESTLYFGWIPIPAKGLRVFKTQDSNLIGLFESYFDLLLSNRIDEARTALPDVNKTFQFDASKFIGRWMSIRRKSNETLNVDQVERYAVLDIGHANGAWSLSLRMFEWPEYREHGKIVGDMIVLVKNTITYRFECELSGNRGIESGIGCLNLIGDNRDQFAVGRYCHLVGDESKQSISVKLDSRFEGQTLPLDQSVVEKYLGKIKEHLDITEY